MSETVQAVRESIGVVVRACDGIREGLVGMAKQADEIAAGVTTFPDEVVAMLGPVVEAFERQDRQFAVTLASFRRCRKAIAVEVSRRGVRSSE